jgi:hypothetical protein
MKQSTWVTLSNTLLEKDAIDVNVYLKYVSALLARPKANSPSPRVREEGNEEKKKKVHAVCRTSNRHSQQRRPMPATSNQKQPAHIPAINSGPCDLH